jgi:hypothetical protein
MDLNLSAIGQRVFIPVFGRRDQGSRLPARPHHSQTRPWDPARRNQKLGPRKSHRHALSRGSTAYCSHQIPVLGPQDIQLRVAAARLLETCVVGHLHVVFILTDQNKAQLS